MRKAGSTVRLDLLAKHVRVTRADLSVREAAKEIGCSAATISRVENGYAPDLETFKRLCTWMLANPNTYLNVPLHVKRTG